MESFVADCIFVDAAPQAVFSALVEGSAVRVWAAAEDVDAGSQCGAHWGFSLKDECRFRGVIETFESPRRLEIAECYHDCGDDRRGPMTVSFTLEDLDGGVWLTVRQGGLDAQPSWQPFAESTRKAWIQRTVALKRHVEGI